MASAPRLAIKSAMPVDLDFAALHRMAKSKTPVLQNEQSLKWMDTDLSTRKTSDARNQNERATRLLYILNLAKDAFGSEALAKKFLMHRHPKLRATPLSKLETEWGGREVERILNGMIYGLPY